MLTYPYAWSQLVKMDEYYSAIIHKWEWGYFDLLVFFPAIVFGVWGVPFFVFYYYWAYNSPLLLISVISATLVNESLKYVFKRARPHPSAIGQKYPLDLRSVHNNPSFPSGDTAQASVMAVTLLWHGFSAFALFMIPLGAFGRVYYGSHYIGDCFVGALLGLVTTVLVNVFLFNFDFGL